VRKINIGLFVLTVGPNGYDHPCRHETSGVVVRPLYIYIYISSVEPFGTKLRFLVITCV
jgi:hypothetical protein